jgi:heme exporter protein D
LNSSIDKTDLTTNDALTLTVTITGKGNIELISAPKIEFPSDFETYDPKVTTRINKTGSGVSGTKKFDYLAIPRTAGDYTVKPVSFCFFDPADGQYHVYRTKTFHIHVKKGKGTGVVYTTTDQQGIHIIGKDIRHIKEGPFDLHPANDFLFGTTLYYLLLALPVLLLLLILLITHSMKKRKANISLVKNRKAQKIARSRLTKAQKLKRQGNESGFYEEIAQALWGYISDKFNLQKANLSMETVKTLLEQKNVAPETIQVFLDTLNNIEYARFAPGDTKGKMENIYSEALHAIMQAEKSLK